MDGAELALTAARGAHLAAALAAFGIAVFGNVVAPPLLRDAETAARDRFETASRRLYRAAIVVAAAAGLVWLIGAAADAAEADSLADAAAAIWPMLTDTPFGRDLGLRLVLLAGAGLVLGNGASGWRRTAAASAAGAAVLLQAWAAHAAAASGIDRAILLGAESLHLLAVGAWLGSLPVLLILVRLLPPELGARALHRFSPFGLFCVAIIAVSALAQGWLLIGSVPAVFDSDYGCVALLKAALFLAMLALAATNRFHHARVLGGTPQADATRWLCRCVGLELALGIAVVLAAALLAGLPPPVDTVP